MKTTKQIQNYLDWEKYYNITDSYEWQKISLSKNLSKAFIRKFQDKLDWFRISLYLKNLSIKFLAEFKNKICWYELTSRGDLTEKIIRAFPDDVSWKLISTSLSYPVSMFSEEFFKDFADKLDWYAISKYKDLTEDFIIKHRKNINWILISEYQKLSEEFIIRFEQRLNWYTIFKYQKHLSTEFINKFKLKYPIEFKNATK